MDEKGYPILEHLGELRRCLLRALAGVVLSMCVCLIFADDILAWLRRPMQSILGEKSHFVVLVPYEYFFAEMKASLVAGIFLSSPWALYQIWLFVAPGLYRREKRLMGGFIVGGALFFVLGAFFAYTLVFPSMFEFFIGGLPADVQGNFSVGLLFGFATNTLLGFGLVFETPILVFLLVFLDIIDLKSLSAFRRYMIVIAFVLGAIITPSPDPLSQTMIAVPMILLYELGILAARIFLPRIRQGSE